MDEAHSYIKVRDTIGGALYFGSYEYVKHSLGPQQGRDASHGAAVFFAGVACGSASSALVYCFSPSFMSPLTRFSGLRSPS